ncbi:MAG: hypothetical protein WBB85_13580 [Albidovulum sp.]|uniref:hypothetical protein n=1 Tax=Albidovulum sp. TaxID=1872424 RepID=UPI003CB63B1F
MVRNGRSGRIFLAGLAVVGAALLANSAIIAVDWLGLISEPRLSRALQLTAAALSWLCLWIWIAMLFMRPRILRRRRS